MATPRTHRTGQGPPIEVWRASPGLRVEAVETTPSTNALVAARARAGEPPGLVVVTGHQSAGRGRLDRSWVTPPGAALTVSLLVDPAPVPVGRWPWLPLLTGLALAEALHTAYDVDAALKWPNDLLLSEPDGLPRKVSGILVERVEVPGDGALAVVGVGLNVSTTREDLPVDTATSLRLAGVADADRSVVLAALLEAFTTRLDAWRHAGGTGLRADYEAACSTVGRHVAVQLPAGAVLQGRATGVDADGRLRVDDGRRVHVLGAGDVVHVRPGG